MLKDLVAIVDNGEAARGFIKHATAFAAAQDAHLAISLMMDIFDNAAVLPPFDYYPVILDRIDDEAKRRRSEEHTSELQSLMRISYAVFSLKKKKPDTRRSDYIHHDTIANTL